jgi:ADP-ribose pyrophosphatase YjhB (NUDIX family)
LADVSFMAETNPTKLAILTQLLKSEKLRYGDIKSPEMDNDLFNYHLQSLVKNGLVEKTDKEYSLSPLGRYEVAEQNPLDLQGQAVDRFKINVLTLVLRKQQGHTQILLQRRKKHPFYNTVAVMGGVIRKGELLTEAASARLQMKTGLTGQFVLCGMWRNINLDKTGVMILEDILFHICCTDQYQGELLSVTEHGENFWVDLEEAVTIHERHPGTFHHLAPFLTGLLTNDFRKQPLFYWEHKQTIKEF